MEIGNWILVQHLSSNIQYPISFLPSPSIRSAALSNEADAGRIGLRLGLERWLFQLPEAFFSFGQALGDGQQIL